MINAILTAAHNTALFIGGIMALIVIVCGSIICVISMIEWAKEMINELRK